MKLLLLAALHEPPREKNFVVAGTELINLHGRLQTVPFTHSLLQPEKLQDCGAQVGDTLYIEATVTPITNQPGRVLIFPRFIRHHGKAGVEKDAQGKYVQVGGFNQLLVSGVLHAEPTVETFAFGQRETTLQLTTDTRGGLLTVISHGLLAEPVAHTPVGQFLTLQGRLAYLTRQDPGGRELHSAYLDISRSDAAPPRPERQNKKRPAKTKANAPRPPKDTAPRDHTPGTPAQVPAPVPATATPSAQTNPNTVPRPGGKNKKARPPQQAAPAGDGALTSAPEGTPLASVAHSTLVAGPVTPPPSVLQPSSTLDDNPALNPAP